MADSKKTSFSKSPILIIFLRKFQRLVLGLVGLIEAKGIDVAQLYARHYNPLLNTVDSGNSELGFVTNFVY